MKYRELLELYKKGELAQQEAEKVRTDIERQEAITDYLLEDEDVFDISLPEDFSQGMQDTTPADSADFAKTINRSIRKAFQKLAVTVLVLALIMILFVQFALPQIVSSFYYDPGKIIDEGEYRTTKQIELDMAVYSRLMLPGYYRDGVNVTDRGFGNYDINISQSVSYNRKFSDVSGKIEKGRLTLYNNNVLRRPPGNIFAWYDILSEKRNSYITDQPLSDFLDSSDYGDASMNPAATYLVFVTLNQQMPYEDFIAWTEKEGIPGVLWCAPCTRDYSYPQNLGFYYDFMYGTSMSWDRETYPNLFFDTDEDVDKENTMLSHFTSQLRYLASREDFCEMMKIYPKEFNDAADYVEKNGLRIYGFVTMVNKKQAEYIKKADQVFRISAEELI